MSEESAETDPKRGLIRFFVSVTAVIAFAFAAFFIWIAQPCLRCGTQLEEVAVNDMALRAHVQKLSQEFVPRDWTNTENLNKAADYIRAEFQTTKAEVRFQEFTARNRTYRNVIASFGDKNAARYVVGAHYDAFQPLPGADDNASGVAGLIELAKLVDRSKEDINIDLVAFSLEEPPFFGTENMGSFNHAKALKDAGTEVKLMISLEMIGVFTDNPGSQLYPFPLLNLYYPSTANFISLVGDFTGALQMQKLKRDFSSRTDLRVYSVSLPRNITPTDLSNNRNYAQFGYNSIMVTDTAFYRNFSYHTNADTMGNLDFVRMGKVVSGIYGIVSADN